MPHSRKFGRLPRTFDSAIPHFSALRMMSKAPPDPIPESHDWATGMPEDLLMLLNDSLGCCTCFPAGTKIRMADGTTKNIEDIKLLDTVVTAERNTGIVTNLMVRHIEGHLLKIRAYGHSHLRLTDEHPVMTRRGYTKAKDLTSNDWIALPSWRPMFNENIYPEEYFTHEDLRLAEIKLPRIITLTPGFGRIIGLFLAEGSTNQNTVRWTFCEDEIETYAQDIVTLFELEFGIKTQKIQRKNKTVDVRLCSKAWRMLFEKLCGKGASNKTMHADLWAGDDDFLRAILLGWMDGDGHRRDNTANGVSVSHSLILDMYNIAQQLKLRPRINYRPLPSGGDSKLPSWNITLKEEDNNFSSSTKSGSGVYQDKQSGRWIGQVRIENKTKHVGSFESYEDAELAVIEQKTEHDVVGNGRSYTDDTGLTWRKVVEVSQETFTGYVFNFSVQGDESYIAEGIGVHNCAAVLHSQQVWTFNTQKAMQVVTDAEALWMYENWAGYDPNDPSTDQGANEQTILTDWLTGGFLGDGADKLSAFIEIDPRNLNDIRRAIYRCGLVYIGFEVPRSLENNDPPLWDIVPRQSQIVGGHCLAGDTKIPLLSGESITIAEMAASSQNEWWVYSTDANGSMMPGRAHSARLTNKNAEVIRITLDNGESFVCTPNHPIMLRDGSYQEAGNLLLGASLMPNYRRISDNKRINGYEEFWDNAAEKWDWTHRRVALAECNLQPGLITHHIDFCKTNNEPRNLFPMSWEEHTELHAEAMIQLVNYAQSDRGRETSRNLMKKLWNDSEWRAARLEQNSKNGKKVCAKLATEGRSGFQIMSPEERKQQGRLNGDRLRGVPRTKQAVDKGYITRKHHFDTDPEFSARMKDLGRQNIAEYNRLISEGKKTMTEAQLRARQQNGKKLNEKRWNHTVVSIEPYGNADVYDLTVDDYHNFAIDSGIFVHNCIILTGYDANTFSLISWGKKYKMTTKFFSKFTDEVYALVDQDWVTATGSTPLGMTLQALIDQMNTLKSQS